MLASASQEKGSPKSGRPGKFIVNHDPAYLSARDRDYFTPLVWIDHHVCEHSLYSIAVHFVSTVMTDV